MRHIIIALLLACVAGSARAEDTPMRGDVNGDKQVTIADVTALVNILLGKATAPTSGVADINGDKKVTIADVTALVNIILGKETEPGTETGEISDDPATGPANAPKRRP